MLNNMSALLALLMIANSLATPVPDPAPIQDDIPELDFSGYEFRVLRPDDVNPTGSWLVAEENGEIVNDALYRRQKVLSERFNIRFTELNGEKHLYELSILSGDDTLDVAQLDAANAFRLASEGYNIPISELPYIDLDKGYWDADLNRSLAMNGKQYFALEVGNLSALDSTHMLAFNKAKAEDYALGDLYKLTADGLWTLDKFGEFIMNTTYDINGDAMLTKEDHFGYLSSADDLMQNLLISSGVETVGSNDKGLFELTLAADKKPADLLDRMIKSTELTWFPGEFGFESRREMFEKDQSLFLDITAGEFKQLRDLEHDFGILPYPKNDAAQESYLTRVEDAVLTCIPLTTRDPKITGAVLEAFASETANSVYTAAVNINLGLKYVRDEGSAQMLDIILADRVLDLGSAIYREQTGKLFTDLTTSRDLSLIEKESVEINKALDKINSSVLNIN